jgi:TRAP-type mannitol/chloroaromatic compound transport system permease small subunit
MIFLFGLLTWLTIPFALYSFSIRECTGGIVAIPIYPAKLIIPIVTALITMQLIYEIIREI